MNFPREEQEEEQVEVEADGEADQLGRACTERGSSQVKMMGMMTRTEIGQQDCRTLIRAREGGTSYMLKGFYNVCFDFEEMGVVLCFSPAQFDQ